VRPGPVLTRAAVDHLEGRTLLLRVSPKHGCCGGHALLPVAEIGPPDDPEGYRSLDVEGVTVLVDPRLGDEITGWTVDAVGFRRWKRLQLEGTQGLDPALR
jgi:hypothetical protein